VVRCPRRHGGARATAAPRVGTALALRRRMKILAPLTCAIALCGCQQTVLPCNALPAAGTWQDITPAPFRARPKLQTLSVVVDPNDPSIVYAVAGDKTNGGDGGTGVYRSLDCGANWAKVSTGRNAADLETGDVWQLAIAANDSKTIYATNGYGDPPTLFKSSDGGVNWDPLTPDTVGATHNFVQTFALDRNDASHIVLTFHEDCLGAYAPMCMAESKDAGATWRLFKGPASGWKEGAGIVMLGGDSWLFYDGDGVFFTSDGGKSFSEPLKSYAGLLMAWVFGGYVGSDKNVYLGVGNTGILYSPLAQIDASGNSWQKLTGSPIASGIVDDGERLYASNGGDMTGQPFYSAPLTQLSSWTQMKSPQVGSGGNPMVYDPAHHIVYSANWSGGLWRLVTR
jgi:photosystem II stability/assembly factor-like uncharacterized protein